MTRFDGHNAWLTTRPSDQQPKSRRTRPPKPDRPGGPVIAASMPVGGAPLPRAAKPPRPVRRKRTLHDVHLGKDGTPLLLDGHTPADPPA